FGCDAFWQGVTSSQRDKEPQRRQGDLLFTHEVWMEHVGESLGCGANASRSVRRLYQGRMNRLVLLCSACTDFGMWMLRAVMVASVALDWVAVEWGSSSTTMAPMTMLCVSKSPCRIERPLLGWSQCGTVHHS